MFQLGRSSLCSQDSTSKKVGVTFYLFMLWVSFWWYFFHFKRKLWFVYSVLNPVLNSGLYACVITAKPQPNEVLLALSLADASVYVTVSHSSDERKGDVQEILVPFLPAFYLYQSELVFSITQLTGMLQVLGVEKVLEKLEVREMLLFLSPLLGREINPSRRVLGEMWAWIYQVPSEQLKGMTTRTPR